MAESARFVREITQAQRRLHSFILSMVWNPAEADDVLQETNLVLWEKAEEYDSSRPFLPWAMRFAQLQAMAWLKRRRRQQARMVFDDDLARLLATEAAADESAADARRRALTSCLKKLRPEQREIIARRYEPDASVNAMAEAGGTTPKAISDRLRRIRRTLLECIQTTLAKEAFMNTTSADLEALFNRLADGLASEADEQELGEHLRASAEARQAYRQFMTLHSALHWDYVAAVSPDASMEAPPPVSADAGGKGWLVAFAAGTVAASVLALVLMNPFATETSDAPIAPLAKDGPESEATAALLVNEVDAEFAAGREPEGVRFRRGRYELIKGAVHLRFAQGADLVLTSPARFEVADAQHIRLDYGEIRVTAPPAAKGFTITTRGVNYVDLGTEFGLRVDSRSGASDLYVFDGQVNVADPDSGEVLSEFVGGESSRFVNGEAAAAPELEGHDFPTPGAIGFRRWQQYEQRMRGDRGLIAFYPFDRTANETALVNTQSDQRVAPGRIQGARWTTGRWPGKDALLFDRDADFVQLDIPGVYEELTIAAWVKVDRLDYVFNAILNSDGYDRGDVHFQLTRQGFPRGGVVVDGAFRDNVMGKAVPLGRWAHVASVISTRTRSQQIYVNGALARERRWQSDSVLRPGSCRLGNWLAVEGAGPMKRAFRGRVDELAIWNRALTADEVGQLVEDGRPGLLWTEQ